MRRVALFIPAFAALLIAGMASAAPPDDDELFRAEDVAAWSTMTDRPDREWEMSQDSDDPAPTRAQFELGLSLTERILSPDEKEVGYDGDGVPRKLFKGVLGVYGSQTAGFTVVVGQGISPESAASGVLAGLPAGAADNLTIVEAEAPVEDYIAAWRSIFSFEWTSSPPSMAGALEAESQKIVIHVQNTATPEDLERLRNLSPLIDVVETEGGFQRLIGGRNNDGPPARWGGARTSVRTASAHQAFPSGIGSRVPPSQPPLGIVARTDTTSGRVATCLAECLQNSPSQPGTWHA